MWFPQWPVQRIFRAQPELDGRPLGLTIATARGLQIRVCSPLARTQGIRPGMSLAEARGVCSRLVVAPFDPAADRERLRVLAVDLQRFTPLAGLEPGAELHRGIGFQPVGISNDYSTGWKPMPQQQPESILLDMTGSENLFGGEESLLRQVIAQVGQQGYSVRVAAGETVGATWAVSHYGPEPVTQIPPGGAAAFLDALPPQALRLSPKVLEQFSTLGLKTIAALRKLPRSTLPARFGPELLQRLDQAYGAEAEQGVQKTLSFSLAETFHPERLEEPIRETWTSDTPVTDRNSLSWVWAELLDRLLTSLEPQRLGIQELQGRLIRADGPWHRLPACGNEEPQAGSLCHELRLLRPSNSRRHLLELLELQTERRSPFANDLVRWLTEGIATVQLEVVRPGRMLVSQQTLFEKPPYDGSSVRRDRSSRVGVVDRRARRTEDPSYDFLERLSSRLGADRVLRCQLQADPVPEYAVRLEPWVREGEAPTEPRAEIDASSRTWARCRPLRLLPQPEGVFRREAGGGRLEETEPEHLLPPPAFGLLPEFHWRGVAHAVLQAWGPERIESGWWRSQRVRRDYYRVQTDQGSQLWLFHCLDTDRWFLHGCFE